MFNLMKENHKKLNSLINLKHDQKRIKIKDLKL